MFCRLALFLLLGVFSVGCGKTPRYVDYFPYHDDGMAKPTVALLPIMDHSGYSCCWNLADELNSEMRFCCLDNAGLYLWPKKDVLTTLEGLGEVDFFGKDLCFYSKFKPCEFVIVIDLIEHCFVPYQKGIPVVYHIPGSCSTVLKMKLRVRKVDIRCEKPCVVLQEIIESNHMMPFEHERMDYSVACYGTTWYEYSPLARAHKRMISDLAVRLEKVAYRAR